MKCLRLISNNTLFIFAFLAALHLVLFNNSCNIKAAPSVSETKVEVYVNGAPLPTINKEGRIITPFMRNGQVFMPLESVSYSLNQPFAMDYQEKKVYFGSLPEPTIRSTYEVNDFKEAEGIELFVKNMKFLLCEQKDKKAFSNFISYPIFVSNSNKIKQYKNSKKLLKNWNNIFTKSTIEKIDRIDLKNAIINYQGVSLSDGLVWVTPSSQRYKFLISLNL